MSRTKRTSDRSARDQHPSPRAEQSATTAGSRQEAAAATSSTGLRHPRRLLLSAIALAAGWWLLLGGLALFTANPVTLNREQIRRAPYVATGTLRADGTVAVEKEWKRRANLDTLTLPELGEAGYEPGQSYLIPVLQRGSRYRVMPAPWQKTPEPRIYPATPEAVRQLEGILKDRRTRPLSSAGFGR